MRRLGRSDVDLPNAWLAILPLRSVAVGQADLPSLPGTVYDIKRRKADSIKLNFGSLYSVVESLEKRGLIEVEGAHKEGNRQSGRSMGSPQRDAT